MLIATSSVFAWCLDKCCLRDMQHAIIEICMHFSRESRQLFDTVDKFIFLNRLHYLDSEFRNNWISFTGKTPHVNRIKSLARNLTMFFSCTQGNHSTKLKLTSYLLTVLTRGTIHNFFSG